MDQIKVRKLRRKGQSLLVAFTDADNFDQQVFIPVEVAEEVDNDYVLVSKAELDIAIPNGFQWELILEDVLIPADVIARALYRNGVRTQEDFVSKPNQVIGAVNEAAAPIRKMIQIYTR